LDSAQQIYLSVLYISNDRGENTPPQKAFGQNQALSGVAWKSRLDVQPNQTTQAAERAEILNIGGFSDQVFEVISAFASGQLEADHWIARIEAVEV